MRKLTLLGIATLFMLLLTQAASAVPTSYKLCNKGKIEVRYATAIRSGNSLFGYSWNLIGWYPILPGKCDDAYHGSDKDPDEPIYVAIAFKDSTGVWGAATFPKLHGETTIGCVATFLRDCVHTESGKSDIDTKLCVAKDSFKYHLNGNINLPCESGYFPFKAALYLEPVEWQCSKMPGQPTYCSGGAYSFDFAPDDDSRAVAAGPSGSGNAPASSNSASASASDSSGPSIGTALAVLGALAVGAAIAADSGTPPKPFESGTLNAVLLEDKIVRRSGSDKWYFADGSPVPAFYHLEGRAKSYLLDAPLQRSVSDPGVVEAKKALQQGLGDWSGNGHIELLPVGRLYYSYVKNPQHDLHRQTVNLVSLDFTRASQEHNASGQTWLRIPCKGNQACDIGIDQDSTEHFSNEEIYDGFYLYFTGTQNAEAIWNALLKLRDLYPAEPAVVAR